MIFKILSLTSLILLASCGEEVAKNNRPDEEGSTTRDGRTPTNPGLEAEVELSEYFPSQNLRTRGSKIYSFDNIREKLKSGTIETSSHLIPNLETDLESTVAHALPAESDCGLDKTMTVTEKRIDCQNKNPLMYKWEGKTNGLYGEGNWLLVMKEGAITLWADTNTGLIWSALLEKKSYKTSNFGSETESASCVASSESKELGYLAETNIKWRLPTRNDFLLADLNGARFVLSDDDNTFWSASPIDSTTSWAIEQSTGILIKKNQSESLSIRCVGIDLR